MAETTDAMVSESCQRESLVALVQEKTLSSPVLDTGREGDALPSKSGNSRITNNPKRKYMTKSIVLSLAAAAAALAAAATSIAHELGADNGATSTAPATAVSETPTQPEAAAEPKRRGRGAAAASETTTSEPAKPTAKTYDQLRELIKPLVENAQGEEVKKVIAKYVPDGSGLKTLATAEFHQHHAAFEKDISALGY